MLLCCLKQNTASTTQKITALIDYFGESGNIIGNLNASGGVGDESQSCVNVSVEMKIEKKKKTLRLHDVCLSGAE